MAATPLTVGTDFSICWQQQVTSLPSAVVICCPCSIISMEVTSLPVSMVFTIFCVRMSHTLQCINCQFDAPGAPCTRICIQESRLYEACHVGKHANGLSALL